MKVGKQIFGWAKRGIRNLPGKAAGLYRKAILQPQIDMNKELADYSYDKNLEMWNLQNEYNSPSAQRQRMEEAGFNPNYMAGGGASSTGSASPASMPQYNVQAPAYEPMQFYQRMLQAAQGILSLRQGVANIRKTVTQTGKLGTEKEFLDSTAGVRKGNLWQWQSASQAQQDLAEQLHMFRGGYSHGDGQSLKMHLVPGKGLFHQQRTALDQQIEERAADIWFKHNRNALARFNIYSSDHPAYRLGIKALDTIGVNPLDWLKSGSQGLSNYLNTKRGR